MGAHEEGGRITSFGGRAREHGEYMKRVGAPALEGEGELGDKMERVTSFGGRGQHGVGHQLWGQHG